MDLFVLHSDGVLQFSQSFFVNFGSRKIKIFFIKQDVIAVVAVFVDFVVVVAVVVVDKARPSNMEFAPKSPVLNFKR